tara:strand:- start:11395 stop:14088 length:2694 start_codon:yes stop_codon:yes gene_type:complete
MNLLRLAWGSPLLLCWLASGAHAQDDCSTATPISATGAYLWTNTGFTESDVDPGAPCLASGGTTSGAPASDYWFVYTVAGPGNWRLDTIGSGFDTVIQVSTGTCGTLVCVDYDRNAAGDFESRVDLVNQMGGEVYLVQVGQAVYLGQPPPQGTGVLNVGPTPTPPTNNTCMTPDTTTVTGVGQFAWFDAGATTSDFDGGGFPCAQVGAVRAPHNDLFFTFTAPTANSFRIDTFGSGADTVLQVHDGIDCAATCLASNDDADGGGPGESLVLLPDMTIGETVLLQVGTWSNVVPIGIGILNVSTFVPPANDTCSAPVDVAIGPTLWDNTVSTSSEFRGALQGAPPVAGSDHPRNDLFYRFVAPQPGTYTVHTVGSGFDTVLNLYAGGDCNATYLQTSNDEGAPEGESRVFMLNAAVNDEFLIQVGSRGGLTLSIGVLSVELMPPPGPGNECSSPLPIAGFGATAWNNVGMTTEGFGDGALDCPSGFATVQPKQDLFFVWTATVSGDVQFDTIGSGADTVLSLHDGADCSATCLMSSQNEPAAGNESRVIAAGLQPGDQVLLQVGTFGHLDVVAGMLNVSSVMPATNDTCSTPRSIVGEGVFSADLLHPNVTTSGFDGGDPTTCFSASNLLLLSDLAQIDPDVFFVWTATCPGTYSVSTDPTSGVSDTKLNVHLGSDCSATCLVSHDNLDPAGGNLLSEVQLTGVIAGTPYLIQVGTWHRSLPPSFLQLTILNQFGPCGVGALTISCDPASPHTGGGSATLLDSTLGAATTSGLHLECSGGPVDQFGFFLVSPSSTTQVAVFDGVLCLDNPQGRYNPGAATNQGRPALNSLGQFDASGVLQSLTGTAPSTGGQGYDVPSALPFVPAGQAIAPGDTWSFQCWFRDGASANFSDVLDVQFP